MQGIQGFLGVMEWINKILMWLIGILLGGIFLLIISQVFFRYVIPISVHWTEEAARFLTIWTVFLGVAIAMKHKSLLAVEVIVQFIPKKIEYIFRIIVLIFSMILMIYLIYLGINLSMNAAAQDSTALGVSMWIPYAAIPVGSFFTLLNVFVVMIETFQDKREQII